MKIAIFGKKFDDAFEACLNEFLLLACSDQNEIFIYKPFYDFIAANTCLKIHKPVPFLNHSDLPDSIDFFFTFGGDGTFLDAVKFVRNKNIPLIGINTGRMGFLANIPKNKVSESLHLLFSGKYSVEKRKMIAFDTLDNPFIDFPYGLNEITVQKSNNSLINIYIEVNGIYLHTYYTDGIIISTPTGSTAYSMSAGGPIMTPDCNALIISPIASHNLSVRPIVIPGEFEIKLTIESRNYKFLATIDSQTAEMKSGTVIKLAPAPFTINTIIFHTHHFFNTIRDKLHWGADIRIIS